MVIGMVNGRKPFTKRIPYKYLISLCILGLIGILGIVFAIYTYYDYQHECQQIAGREAQHKVNSIVSQMDEQMEMVRQYYVSSMEEDEMVWVLENELKYSDYSRYKGAYDIMASTKLFGDYISGFTFANFETGWVLNNKGLFPLSDTANSDILYELFAEDSEGFERYYWTYDRTVAIENTIDRMYRVTVEAAGLSLVIKLPLVNLNEYGLFIANLNMNTLESDVMEWLHDYEEVVIVSPDGKFIFSSNEQLNDITKELMASGNAKEEPEKVSDTGSYSYMVSSKQSGVLGWDYYVYYNLDEGQFPGMQFSWALILMMCFIALCCLFLAIYIIYRPIGMLVKNVADTEHEFKGDEIDYLANKFADLKGDKQVLEQVMNQQQDKLVELFELRLIRGEVRSSDEWNEYFESLHLKPSKYFATAVMVLDLRGEDEAQSNVNEDAICLKIVEELPDNIKHMVWMPPVYNACTIFCIFSADDEEILLQNITEFYENMQKHVQKHYGFRILMGVSTTHTNLHHIRAAYRESVNALTMQNESCSFYLASSTINGSTYNNSFERDIQTAIKGIDKVQCYKVVDEFSQFIKAIGVHDDALVYILRFVNTIILTAIDAGVNLDELYPDGLKKVYSELMEVIEYARVRRYIKMLFVDRIIQARMELLEDSSYSMMEEIERKIAESKGNITLTECADALGVHQTYIWKILKMERGKSFSDYLEEYKLNEAKRLLLQTDMTVADIAAELNYTNAQNFIRFFSKGTGVTPGKFRKLY